jgi:hypothetical protein
MSARERTGKPLRSGKRDPQIAAAIGRAFSKSGYKGALQAWLDRLNSPSDHAYVSPLCIATTYPRLGDSHRAFERLARACQGHDSEPVFLRVEPALDNLHSDPRYAELVRTIGFPQ